MRERLGGRHPRPGHGPNASERRLAGLSGAGGLHHWWHQQGAPSLRWKLEAVCTVWVHQASPTPLQVLKCQIISSLPLFYSTEATSNQNHKPKINSTIVCWSRNQEILKAVLEEFESSNKERSGTWDKIQNGVTLGQKKGWPSQLESPPLVVGRFISTHAFLPLILHWTLSKQIPSTISFTLKRNFSRYISLRWVWVLEKLVRPCCTITPRHCTSNV